MPPHCIRLRGPWQSEVLEHFPPSAGGSRQVEPVAGLKSGQAHRVGVGNAWQGGDFRGRVRFRRKFHRPTGLNNARVHLVIQNELGACVYLNGRNLGKFTAADSPCRMDVTGDLEVRNELWVDVATQPDGSPGAGVQVLPGPQDEAGLVGHVWLEISEA